MRKSFTKLLGVVATIAMCVTLMPGEMAMAEDTEDTRTVIEVDTDARVQESDMTESQLKTAYFGSWSGCKNDDIVWDADITEDQLTIRIFELESELVLKEERVIDWKYVGTREMKEVVQNSDDIEAKMAKEENPEVFGDITFGSDVTALVFELADGAEVLVYDGYQSWSGNDSLVIEFHSPENSDEVTEIFYFGNRTDLKLSKPILWGDIEDYTVYLRFAKVWASTQNSEEDTKVEEPKEEDTKDETPVADDKEEDKSEESVRVDENGTKWYFDEKGEYKLIGKKNDRKCYSTENVYIVKQGDCLWSIARELLGDGKKYTQLFTRNGDIVKRAELIHIGQEIIYTPINQ